MALAAALLMPAPALACTLCHSDAAALIRARLFQPDLWWNLGVTAVPLLLLVALVGAIAREPAA